MQRTFYDLLIFSVLPLLCMVYLKLLPEANAQVAQAVSVSQSQSDNIRNQTQSAATLAALELQFKKECETPGTSTYCPSAAMAKRAAKASATASATTSATGTATSTVGGLVSDQTTSTVGSTTSSVGSATDTAGVRLACMALKCDASPSAKSSCALQCSAACSTSSVYCNEECDNPSAVAGCHGQCVAKCVAACEVDFGVDEAIVDYKNLTAGTSFIFQLLVPVGIDQGLVMGSEGYASTQKIPKILSDYRSCISDPKTSAGIKQASCRKLCRSIGNQTASLVRMSTQVAGSLSSLSGLVTGNKKGGKGKTPNDYSPDDTGDDNLTGTGSAHTGSEYLCAGKTGEALRECNCTSGGWNWVNGKCLDDDQLAFHESLKASVDPEVAKGDEAHDTEDDTQTKISGTGELAATGTGLGVLASASNQGKGTLLDKALDRTDEKASADEKASINDLGQDALGGEAKDQEAEEDEDFDEDYDEDSLEGIIGRKGSGINSSRMNIFDSISKLYKDKYDAKVLGHLSIKKKPQSSDKLLKTRIIRKGNKGRERLQ